MHQQVFQALRADAHVQLRGVTPVQLQPFAGLMLLAKEQRSFGPVLALPGAHASLEGAALTPGDPAAMALEHLFEKHLGLELRFAPELRFDLRPELGEGIRPSAPMARRPRFVGPRRALDGVFASSLALDASSQRALGEVVGLLVAFHQCAVLLRADHGGVTRAWPTAAAVVDPVWLPLRSRLGKTNCRYRDL